MRYLSKQELASRFWYVPLTSVHLVLLLVVQPSSLEHQSVHFDCMGHYQKMEEFRKAKS